MAHSEDAFGPEQAPQALLNRYQTIMMFRPTYADMFVLPTQDTTEAPVPVSSYPPPINYCIRDPSTNSNPITLENYRTAHPTSTNVTTPTLAVKTVTLTHLKRKRQRSSIMFPFMHETQPADVQENIENISNANPLGLPVFNQEPASPNSAPINHNNNIDKRSRSHSPSPPNSSSRKGCPFFFSVQSV